MKHLDQATLALHAGGDLGKLAEWRAQRHLAVCAQCREEVAAFTGVREQMADLSELPELGWHRLAADMQANIRLGLAAGECVSAGEAPAERWPWAAPRVVAWASLAALLVAGVALKWPPVERVAAPRGVVVESTGEGIRVGDGGQSMGLLHAGARNVTYTVSAKGSMEDRYVDPNTGYVTVNDVDVQ